MTNFLEETVENLKSWKKKPRDIKFIGSLSSGHSCTWEEFEELANFEYDSGFGGQVVASDIVILFEDGSYMNRGEYDGSEWWEYVYSPIIPKKLKKIKHLKSPHNNGWETLSACNTREK